MSEDTAVNLEDDGVQPPAPSPTPEPVAEPPPEPAPEPAEPDVEVEGQKYVPLAALKAEREKARQEAESLKQQVQTIASQLQAQQGFVDFVKNHPNLIQPQAAPPAEPTQNPMAVEMAQRLALFKPDGTLDVDAGSRTITMFEQLAEQTAQKYVAPLQQSRDQQASMANFQRMAATVKDADGHPVNQQALQTLWSQLSPSETAKPEVAAFLALTALGLDRAANKSLRSPEAPPPVVMTEASGGLTSARPVVSDLGRSIAADRGRTEKQWAENMKGFTAKRPSKLED